MKNNQKKSEVGNNDEIIIDTDRVREIAGSKIEPSIDDAPPKPEPMECITKVERIPILILVFLVIQILTVIVILGMLKFQFNIMH